MNAKRLALTMAIALGLTAGGALVVSANTGVSGHVAVDISVFHDDLSASGRWVDRPSYGQVFVPRGMRSGWRPYSQGHWVDTDYGWTWISDEPFGWATYHYGRWYADPQYGWAWVPGSDWGPAWVDFHEGDGYIGWAPLPPSVGFDARYGVGSGGYSISPDSYCFVPQARFLEPRLSTYVVAPTGNGGIFRNTRSTTSYAMVNNRIVNRSFAVNHIEQVTGHRVTRLQVGEATKPGQQVQGNRVAFFRPTVKRAPAVATTTARRTEPVQTQQRATVAGRQTTAAQKAEVEKAAEARRANDAAKRQTRVQTQNDRAAQQEKVKTERAKAPDEKAPVEKRAQQPPREKRAQQEQADRQKPPERQQQAENRRQTEAKPPPAVPPKSVERRQTAPRPEHEQAPAKQQPAKPKPEENQRPPQNDGR